MIKQKHAATGLVSVTALMAGSNVAAAQSWDGWYVGLSINNMSGQMPWDYYSGYDDYVLDKNSAVAGLFAGHNQTLGNGMVLGYEFALQGKVNGDSNGDSSYPQEYNINTTIDGKLKLGKAFGASENVLLYGFAGASAAMMEAASGDGYNVFGVNAGIGVDYKVSDKFSIGAEYIHRQFDAYTEGDGPSSEGNDGLSLRASFHF